jgi:NAD(P)-dependent dehydrogenase (short-subunit alcohol dehydrogenase family)
LRKHAFVSSHDAVIVTGAGGGIGAATVANLVGQEIYVYCIEKNEAALNDLIAKVDPSKKFAIGIVADVTLENDCKTICELVGKSGHKLKGLVNNAAVGAFNLSVEKTSFEEWERIIRINLTSLYLMSKYSLPLIRSAGGGVVVNISSVHAYATSTGVSPYAAAKGGVLALTRSMALDLAEDRIRVVCILPGATDTPMLRQHAQRENKTLAELGFPASDCAIARIAQPEELADVIAFVLSKSATFITGSAIVADGGMLAKF